MWRISWHGYIVLPGYYRLIVSHFIAEQFGRRDYESQGCGLRVQYFEFEKSGLPVAFRWRGEFNKGYERQATTVNKLTP